MNPTDAEATENYRRGLAALRRFLDDFDGAELERAIRHFRSATTHSPGTADHWLALGFALDMNEEADAALAAMRRATALEPADLVAEVFVLTLLAEKGLESEARSGTEDLSTRTGVDLASLRGELQAAGLPVEALSLLRNGFPQPRHFLRSRLEEAMKRAGRSGPSPDRSIMAELDDCQERLAALERELDFDRVPPALRHLKPWVLRLGVGDDPCRERLIDALTAAERDAAREAIGPSAAAVHAWLDAFGDAPLPAEAAGFMYALLAVEDMLA